MRDPLSRELFKLSFDTFSRELFILFASGEKILDPLSLELFRFTLELLILEVFNFELLTPYSW